VLVTPPHSIITTAMTTTPTVTASRAIERGSDHCILMKNCFRLSDEVN